MSATILGVKPRSHYRHYSNPSCQGTLIRQTAEWPIHPRKKSKFWTDGYGMNSYDREFHGGYKEYDDPNEESGSVPVPYGLKVGDAYVDRMWSWDYKKMEEAEKRLSKGLDSPDEELIAFAREYFGVYVVAVRTVYYYNVSSGYGCPRIDYLYKDGPINGEAKED